MDFIPDGDEYTCAALVDRDGQPVEPFLQRNETELNEMIVHAVVRPSLGAPEFPDHAKEEIRGHLKDKIRGPARDLQAAVHAWENARASHTVRYFQPQ